MYLYSALVWTTLSVWFYSVHLHGLRYLYAFIYRNFRTISSNFFPQLLTMWLKQQMRLIYGFIPIRGASHPRLFLASFQLTSKRSAAIRTCLCSVLFISKVSQKIVSIFKHNVEWSIQNNNQPNIHEKDADLLWNRSSRQHDFNRLPLYSEFMACIVLNVHIFLPSIMQTYSHGMFSLLSLPSLLSLHKMRVSKLTIWFDQAESATKCGIANRRSLCSAMFNSKTSWKYVPVFKQSVG